MKKLLALTFITVLLACSGGDDAPANNPNNPNNPDPNPTPTSYTLGGIGPGGGRIFQLDGTGQHGLEVTGVLGLVKWGEVPRNPQTQIYVPVPALGVAIGTGNDNTTKIINHIGNNNGQPYAAKVCYDLVQNGKDDWYLPSREELYAMLHFFKYEHPIADFFSINENTWSSSCDINDPADPDPYNSAPLLNVWSVDWHTHSDYWRQHLYIESPSLAINVRAVRNF
jgi:hypothetical protein